MVTTLLKIAVEMTTVRHDIRKLELSVEGNQRFLLTERNLTLRK